MGPFSGPLGLGSGSPRMAEPEEQRDRRERDSGAGIGKSAIDNIISGITMAGGGGGGIAGGVLGSSGAAGAATTAALTSGAGSLAGGGVAAAGAGAVGAAGGAIGAGAASAGLGAALGPLGAAAGYPLSKMPEGFALMGKYIYDQITGADKKRDRERLKRSKQESRERHESLGFRAPTIAGANTDAHKKLAQERLDALKNKHPNLTWTPESEW